MKAHAAFLLTFVLSICSPLTSLAADIPTDLEMRSAAESWLRGNIALHGRWSTDDPVDGDVSIVSSRSVTARDTLLGMAYEVSSGGVIIVAATKQLPPVLAYSTSGGWPGLEPGPGCNHLYQMIEHVVRRSLRAGPGGAIDAAWSLMTPDKADCPLGTIIGVEPLMGGIDWHQCAPYNQRCPSTGDCQAGCAQTDSLCLLGCVASSLSRLMRCYAYPDSGTGSSSYLWNGTSGPDCTGTPGDTLCADHFEAIDWDHLPETWEGGFSSADSSSLASFCY